MVTLINSSCLSTGFLIVLNWSRQNVISFVGDLNRWDLTYPALGLLRSGSGRDTSGAPCLRHTLPSNGQALNLLRHLHLRCLLPLQVSRPSLWHRRALSRQRLQSWSPLLLCQRRHQQQPWQCHHRLRWRASDAPHAPRSFRAFTTSKLTRARHISLFVPGTVKCGKRIMASMGSLSAGIVGRSSRSGMV